ncbi:MAG: hypothetical protein AB7O96_07550 [Pseudobdellovibrionaceae bacterium]
MKAVTEFPSFTLVQAGKTKASLVAEGKTPEEIQASLGTTYKLEGDKLKYFFNAIEVATSNPEKLRRVLVVTLAEGENTPAKAVKVDEMHYVPDFIVEARPAAPREAGRGGKGGKRKDGPKSSPWGMSPEEKANKNKKPASQPS